MNDANDRAIRSSSLFFERMLEGTGKVVLITNDADNQVRHSMMCVCMRLYVWCVSVCLLNIRSLGFLAVSKKVMK